jgi:tetratricopeptide (TPR) repeat protein
MRSAVLLTLIAVCLLWCTGILAVAPTPPDRPEAPAKASVAPKVPKEMLPRVHDAQKQYEAGNFAAAERIYGEMLKDAPENIFLLSSYGGLLMQTGKHDLAMETLRKIVALTPRDPKAVALERGYADAHFNLAVIYVTQTPPDLEKARQYYIRAVELGEERDASLEALMKVPAKRGPPPAVIPGLPPTPTPQSPVTAAAAKPVPTPQSPVTAATAPAPAKPAPVKPVPVQKFPTTATAPISLNSTPTESVPASQAPVTAGAETVPVKPAPVEPVVLPKPTPPPAAPEEVPDLPPELEATAREGKAQFTHGNYAEAEKIYRQILQKQPNNLRMLTNLGVVLIRTGKYKLAEEFFRKAMTIAPESGLTHCSMGVVYYQEGKYDEAVNELTKALAVNNKDATAHNYLGLTASQKGWQDAAQKELETATDLDPNYGDAHFNLALLLASKEPADRDNARQHYERAIQLGVARDVALEQLMKGPASLAGPSKAGEK